MTDELILGIAVFIFFVTPALIIGAGGAFVAFDRFKNQ
jgi:hypothetical protein